MRMQLPLRADCTNGTAPFTLVFPHHPGMDLALALTGLLVGLAGAPHCAAMCGPACAAVLGSAHRPLSQAGGGAGTAADQRGGVGVPRHARGRVFRCRGPGGGGCGLVGLGRAGGAAGAPGVDGVACGCVGAGAVAGHHRAAAGLDDPHWPSPAEHRHFGADSSKLSSASRSMGRPLARFAGRGRWEPVGGLALRFAAVGLGGGRIGQYASGGCRGDGSLRHRFGLGPAIGTCTVGLVEFPGRRPVSGAAARPVRGAPDWGISGPGLAVGAGP